MIASSMPAQTDMGHLSDVRSAIIRSGHSCERPLRARTGRSITAHYANRACRRQIEKSPLAYIEMSLSMVLVEGVLGR
jgi:hypothetical protein